MGGTYVDCEGTITYTYLYTDCAGNSVDWVYTYTIVFNAPENPADSGSTIACADEAVTPTPPTVLDSCGDAITPTGPTMGGTYVDCEGTITYTTYIPTAPVTASTGYILIPSYSTASGKSG